MTKKTGGTRTTRRNDEAQPTAFEQRYPTIARWVTQEEGWIAIGADDYSHSLVRALYGGGMVWEGADEYGSLDESLRAMEAGISAWLDENRPDELRSVGTGPGIVGTRTRSGKASSKGTDGAGRRTKARPPRSTPDRSRLGKRKQPSPKPKARPQKNDRTKGNAVPSVPMPIAEKIRKLEEIAESLRQNEHFSITRLTTLKGLCKDPKAAEEFALFLARKVQKKMREKEAPKRYRALVNRSVRVMKSYLDEPDEEGKERLHSLFREIEAEQDEYENIPWGVARNVKSFDLLVVEHALKAVLRSDEASFWLYHAARDYTGRTDELVPKSAPMVEDVASFWRKFYDIKG